MKIIDAMFEVAGAWMGLAMALTFVVPPLGLFLLGVLFVFVYPVLLAVAVIALVVGGVSKLFTAW